MSLRYHKRLIAHLTHDTYEPSDIDGLAADLGIAADERDDFRTAVEEMADAGQVVLSESEYVTLPPPGPVVIGEFRKHPKGFGFLIPREATQHGDLFVPAHATLDAVTGDIVRASVSRRRRHEEGHNPYVAEIEEVLERKQSSFSGELQQRGGQWLVFPDGKTLLEPVVVRDASASGAKTGDKVVFEVLAYPERGELAEGVITKVLGEAGRPDVETQAVIEAYQLPGEFPDACLSEARGLTDRFHAELEAADAGGGFDDGERLDLRGTFICTIDPPDARDFDDAISIERIEPAGGGRGWRLGVHIADVSHFVTPGTALDDEARERCNSCYLPRLVIPMLPEVLSNGICSLQERVPRFCKSVFIDYDEGGNVRGTGFRATVIESNKRLTYIEAQALIEGDQERAKLHARTEPDYTPELLAALKEMDTLSRRIRGRRRKAGMIHLDLPEVELVYDDAGHVVDAVPEDDSYTHTLIEMFMVEANEAVARLFEDLGVPLLRRTHPEPVPGEMGELQGFVKVAGYRIPKQPSREDLQSLLDATAGTPSAPAVHMAVLRTLTRAEYSPALIGHFALASAAYAHFTSPIRRYADLTVHTALTEYLRRTNNEEERPKGDGARVRFGKELAQSKACPDEQELAKIGSKCNMREDSAENAERELRQFLVLQLLEKHIGESFPGLVTGVVMRGVFVRLDKYLAEGMCQASDLPVPTQRGGHGGGGFWRIDKKTGALVEKHSGRSYNIGDRVTVTIAEIDLARRQMELVITDASSRDVGKPKRLADRLTLGDVVDDRPRKTGAQKRSQRSKSRDRRKSDHRKDRKGKGKRQ